MGDENIVPITDVDISCAVIVGYPRTREFNLTTHWLRYLYANVLPSFESGGFWKARVELYPGMPNREPFDRNGGQVFLYHRQFDFARHFTLAAGQRKRLLLETLQDGLLRITTVIGWPREPFETAHRRCLERGLEARFAVGKPKSNPRRTAAARLEWLVDVDWVYVYVTFCDRSGQQIGKWEVVSQDVGISAYFPYNVFGKFGWISNDTIRLLSRNGEQCWEVSLDGTVKHVALRVSKPGSTM